MSGSVSLSRRLKELNITLNKADELILNARKGEVDLESVVHSWENVYQQETLCYAPCVKITDEEVFAEVYHRLVHSAALPALLGQQQQLTREMQQLMAERSLQMENLNHKHAQDMSQAVALLSEDQINHLSMRQVEERQWMESGWESRTETAVTEQRRHFRDWVMAMGEMLQTGHLDQQLSLQQQEAEEDGWGMTMYSSSSTAGSDGRLEESFTIHLGTQLKQTHNLRLIRADIMDFCRLPLQPSWVPGCSPDPQRVAMSMSLYSNSVNGLVLMVDDRLSSYTGMEKCFLDACHSAAELHFPQGEQQLQTARDTARVAEEWRKKKSSDGSHTAFPLAEQAKVTPARKTPCPGDVYITRHSNLADVHVVFHTVSDDSLLSGDMGSRHPVLLGIRRILKTCCQHDITTLTLPLLLLHEMSEEMTVGWCLRRAELVYKCVKGFMMEMTAWGVNGTRTLQFLLPKGISDELFASLAAMLPSIFRVSNPLVLKEKVAGL